MQEPIYYREIKRNASNSPAINSVFFEALRMLMVQRVNFY
jgi:hypothetical protein